MMQNTTLSEGKRENIYSRVVEPEPSLIKTAQFFLWTGLSVRGLGVHHWPIYITEFEREKKYIFISYRWI